MKSISLKRPLGDSKKVASAMEMAKKLRTNAPKEGVDLVGLAKDLAKRKVEQSRKIDDEE